MPRLAYMDPNSDFCLVSAASVWFPVMVMASGCSMKKVVQRGQLWNFSFEALSQRKA